MKGPTSGPITLPWYGQRDPLSPYTELTKTLLNTTKATANCCVSGLHISATSTHKLRPGQIGVSDSPIPNVTEPPADDSPPSILATMTLP
jgi:hypothetical protein